MSAAGTGVNNNLNGDIFAEYGDLEGGPLDSIPIELLSSGSTTPLPGKEGIVQQRLKAIRSANELSQQPAFQAPSPPPQPQMKMVNERQSNIGGPPPLAFQMMRAYFTDLARRRLQMQQQQQQQEREWKEANQLPA